jgi:hypothetical protein
MSASRIEGLTAFAFALALFAGSALAQGDATGPPRALGTLDEVPERAPLAPTERQQTPQRGPVTVGDLGTVEGPVAGTLTEANGGLGPRAWAGMERSVAETVLQQVDAAVPSATSRLLLRKLLLTAAPPPQGPGAGAFHRLRLRKLLEAGLVDEAADLAVLIHSPDEETQRAQADAMLFAGRDTEVCSEATAARLASAEPFWVSLRAYCYALNGDLAALDLTRAVMEQRGLADGVLLKLIDAAHTGTAAPADPIAEPNALHLRLLVRLDAPLPENVVNGLGMPAALIGAASRATTKEIRIAAADRALRGGALPTRMLPEILDLYTFMPSDLVAAAALAPSETPLAGLARVRAAMRSERGLDRRTELIVAALRIGENDGLLAPVAALFADEAAAITPRSDWGAWAPLMMRALLLVGRPASAARWHDLLDPTVQRDAGTAYFLRVIFALAAPNDIRAVGVDAALSGLAAETLSIDPRPIAVVRATLALGLYEASGRTMPADARSEIEMLLAQDFAGRRPPRIVMDRLERAGAAARKGEVALTIIDALDSAGVRDLAPDVIVYLTRTLMNADIEDAARMLTLEALLTRSSDI